MNLEAIRPADRVQPIRFHQGRPVPHAHDCKCKVVHRFRCAICWRVRGWCLGAYDNLPDACDFCWFPPPDEATLRNATDGLWDEEESKLAASKAAVAQV
jgi:hypothetical protein